MPFSNKYPLTNHIKCCSLNPIAISA